jgi:hypothetical protein
MPLAMSRLHSNQRCCSYWIEPFRGVIQKNPDVYIVTFRTFPLPEVFTLIRREMGLSSNARSSSGLPTSLFGKIGISLFCGVFLALGLIFAAFIGASFLGKAGPAYQTTPAKLQHYLSLGRERYREPERYCRRRVR